MYTLNCKGTLLVVDKPLVMGIINVTPDSFYEGSRQTTNESILRQVEKMLKDGAAIIDIGGQSTRPGSEIICRDEELARIIEPIQSIQREFPTAIISVDTYFAKVAKEAVDAGASIVNDTSAGSLDTEMIGTVASLHVPYICMHSKGTQLTMQDMAIYDDVSREVADFFIRRVNELRIAGIADIIIDPGFGFAKTIRHNFQLLKNLSLLKLSGTPILVGLSRKSTIYKTLGVGATDALNGSTVLHTLALANGANILRVHDVKEAVEAVTLFQAYQQA
jgi:dihydropteroate synthase